MLSKIRTSLSFHKSGFNTLKLIHKADSSAIPLSMINSLIQSLYPYITIFLSANLIDALITKKYSLGFILIIILLSSNFIIGILLDGLKESCVVKQFKVNQLVQLQIRKKALELDYETFENPKTLELLNSADFSMQHRGGFGYLLENYTKILEAIISIVIALTLVLYLCFKVNTNATGFLLILTSTPISLLIMIIFIISLVIININLSKYFNDKSLKFFQSNLKVERGASYFFNEVMSDYSKGKVIRVFNLKNMILEETKKFWNTIRKNNEDYLPFLKLQQSTNTLLSGLSNGFAYLFVILKVLSNAITIGSLTKYVGAISQLNGALIKLVTYNDEVRIQCSFMKYFVDFMKIENKRNTGSIPIEKRTDNEYEIEFHDVSFSYPGSSNMILNHVSCKLNMKEKMAVVGRNGAGKTTFIKLLCRLYDPTSGIITLNGIDIKKYNYMEYLSLFSVVFQDFSLFAFPLDENVSASLNSDEKKLWRSLELSGVKNRVLEMPQKLKTPIYNYDDGGTEISGGEAQKLAMARALYKDAPFVILDEPTAALDPISEFEIYSNFNKMVEDKTSIYISHRMSSCRFCNDIIVFDNGSIIERGSHDNLIKNSENVYYKLWNAQANYYVVK